MWSDSVCDKVTIGITCDTQLVSASYTLHRLYRLKKINISFFSICITACVYLIEHRINQLDPCEIHVRHRTGFCVNNLNLC